LLTIFDKELILNTERKRRKGDGSEGNIVRDLKKNGPDK